MPTSAPGSSPVHQAARGFTLLELLVVVALIALATGVSVLALREPSRNRLEEEAARLSALLEAARLESRTTGRPVTWRPLTDTAGSRDFAFEPPLSGSGAAPGSPARWPDRWLHATTRAEVLGTPRLVLGPEPLIPAQRLRLRSGDQELVLATDGLAPFRVEAPAEGGTAR